MRVLLGCGFSCGLSSMELEEAWRFVVLCVLSEFPRAGHFLTLESICSTVLSAKLLHKNQRSKQD